jgi:AcrR family transcriptional regulator
MRKIAEAIEYSPATIYLHFASRDEIALQLVREAFADLLRFLQPALSVEDPVERLRAIGRRYIAFGLERPGSYRLIFMEDPKFSSQVIGPDVVGPDDLGGQAFGLLETLVGELIASGRFRAVDRRQAAEILWAGVHGLVSLQLACDGSTCGGATRSHEPRPAASFASNPLRIRTRAPSRVACTPMGWRCAREKSSRQRSEGAASRERARASRSAR